MELEELLAFVDECDVSDAEDQQQMQARSPSVASTRRHCRPSESNGGDSDVMGPKNRPRRDVVEIAALQTQVAALTLELDTVKHRRPIGGGEKALLPAGALRWLTDTERQSRLRSAAQEENERLRAQVHEQMQIATRLVNVLKRNSTNLMLQTLHRFEKDAALRAERIDDDFIDLDHVYHQTDAVLADAEIAKLRPTSFDARIRQQLGRQGFFVEIRWRICVARDHHTTSEAYWQFSPHPSFSKRFIFEHTESSLGETKGYNFAFQSKPGPSRTRFYGQYLLRRYKTDERVVVVWKMLIEPEGTAASSLLRLISLGWSAIYGSAASGEFAPPPSASFTSVQTVARYFPESKPGSVLNPDHIQTVARYFPESKPGSVLNPDHIQQDSDLRTIIDFVTFASKGYAAFLT